MAVRINYGELNYAVGMTLPELQSAIETATGLSGDGFVTLPLLLGGSPYQTIRIRPQYIRFYYEELEVKETETGHVETTIATNDLNQEQTFEIKDVETPAA